MHQNPERLMDEIKAIGIGAEPAQHGVKEERRGSIGSDQDETSAEDGDPGEPDNDHRVDRRRSSADDAARETDQHQPGR